MTPQTQTPKILIGVITYNGHKYCVDELFKSLAKYTYQNFDILFVDNSADNDYIELLKKKAEEFLDKSSQPKVFFVKDEPGSKYDFFMDKIVSSRNLVRKEFLKMAEADEYEYLFWLDSDVICPPDVLERCLSHNKDQVTGLYLGRQGAAKNKVMPVLYDFGPKGHARLMEIKEIINDKLIEVAAAGLGCALVAKKVIEKVKIRYYETSKRGEDVAFFVDAREKFGFRLFADTSIKCDHLDPKENYYFDGYVEKEKQRLELIRKRKQQQQQSKPLIKTTDTGISYSFGYGVG